MAKEITLKISLDGAKGVEKDIDDIGDGLHDLAVRDARAAKEALDRLDRSSLNQIRSQIKQVGETLQETGAKIKNVGQSMQSFGNQLTVGVTLPIVGLGIAAIKSFADVESAVANISSIKPEIDTKALFSQLNEMSTRIPQTAQQLGDGLYNIFSSINVTQAEGLKLLEQFGRGATAAQTDAKTFGTAVLGVMNAYKLSVEDASHVSDVFFNTVNLGVVNGAELANTLGTVTQAAKNAGVGFDELGALIVGVTKEGGEASQNVNNLANFLQKLPTKESSAALKQLGVDVQIEGKFRPVIEVLGDLKEKLDAMPESVRASELQKIFPDAQARTGAQTLLSQLDAIKEALVVNKTVAGAADEAYKKIAATANVQFTLLKNTSVAILAELGSAILPVLQPLIIWLAQNLIPAVKQGVETFKSWSPEMQRVAVAAVAFIAALGPALTIIGTLIVAVGSVVSAVGTLLPIFGAIGGVFASLGGFVISFIGLIGEAGLVASFSVLASVVGTTVVGAIGAFIEIIVPVAVGVAAVVAVIATLIGVGVALYAAYQSNFGGLRDLVNDVFNSIVATVQSGLQAIQDFWTTYGDQIISTATNTFNQVIEFIRPIMTEIVSTIREGWQTAVEVVGPLVTQIVALVKTYLQAMAIGVSVVLASIKAFWSAHGEQIKTIVSAVWTILKTIVMAGIRQIANVITLILAVINGDWRQAWASLKNIVQTGIQASVTIMKSFGTLVITALAYVATELYNIGKNIIQGLINGIKSGAAAIYSEAKQIASSIIGIFSSVPKVQSPSQVTTEIGEFIAEGLAVGMENKESRVIAAAKKIADAVIKEFKDAQKEFSKLAGASPETVRTIQSTNQIKDATSNQQEIIKLRGELKLNNYKPLPGDVAGTSSELRYLREAQKAADDLNKSIDDMNKTVEDSQDAIEKANEAFAEKLDTMRASGDMALLNLQQEGNLIGVTDALERQRIENYYEMLRLRQQMQADGYGQQQIDEAAEILYWQQAQQGELQRIIEIRKQVAAGESLEKSLIGDLTKLQNGNKELSVYEQTLQKIKADLKDISPEQKEQILNAARQIDQQKQFNDQYKQTYDFIRGTLDTLTDSGKSFGDKMKSIFGGVVNQFKKMLLDMIASWLTSKISKLFGGNGSGSGSGGGGLGGIFDIIKNIFNPSGSGIGGGGGGGGNSSGGSLASQGINPSVMQGVGGSSGSSNGGFSGFFGGGLNGTIGGIAGLASIGGGLIGGTAGNVI